MSFASDSYYPEQFTIAAEASVNERADFIAKTYTHLTGAVTAFVGLEALYLNTPIAQSLAELLLGGGQIGWFVVLGAFLLVGMMASAFAQSTTSVALQYVGLSLYVVAESVIFAPLLYYASTIDPSILPTAGIITLAIFFGLTLVVFLTKKDFSFMGPALAIAGIAALAAIILGPLMGFSMGSVLFSSLMVVLASGYILYDTSNVLHHYRIGQHVAASLALFASLATLFWYVIRIVIALTNRD